MKNFVSAFLIGVCVCFFLACENTYVKPASAGDSSQTKNDSFFVARYDVNALTIDPAFDSGRVVGTVQDSGLDEISGMAASYMWPGAFWVEEDSGNENKIYLVDQSGEIQGSLFLDFEDRDWEDMTIAPGPVPDVHYVYLAETGDNNKVYPVKYIYRFEEPALANINDGGFVTSTVDRIAFTFPDGIKNAEAIMVDPLTKDIYVISKEDQTVIYVAPYPQDIKKTFTLVKLAALPMPSVTSAGISPDGSEIIIKNYDRVFYWRKKSNETIRELIKEKPVRLPYAPEQKGESFSWATDGSGYYTSSEMIDSSPPFLFYRREN